MYNGIGLQTARGSGTNGYVQTNRFLVKPRVSKVLTDSSLKGFASGEGTAGLSKKANREILEHDRKRRVELKLLMLEEKLTDQGFTDKEVAERLEEARRGFEREGEAEGLEDGEVGTALGYDSKISDTQTHQIAARKERQMETMRAALGIGTENKSQIKLPGTLESHFEDMNDEGEGEPTNGYKGKKNGKGNVHDTSDLKKKSHGDESGEDNTFDKSARHKKQRSGRGRRGDSSDSDVIVEKVVKRAQKKSRTKTTTSESDDTDADAKRKKKPSRTSRSSRRRHDSDSSDSESDTDSSSDSDSDVGREHERSLKKRDHREDSGSKYHKRDVKEATKKPRRSSSSSDSDQSDVPKKKMLPRKSGRSRRHKSYSSGSEYESDSRTDSKSSSDSGSGRRTKKPLKKHQVREDYGSDKILGKSKTRHDSDDESDQEDRGLSSRKRKEEQSTFRAEKVDIDLDDYKGKRGEDRGRYKSRSFEPEKIQGRIREQNDTRKHESSRYVTDSSSDSDGHGKSGLAVKSPRDSHRRFDGDLNDSRRVRKEHAHGDNDKSRLQRDVDGLDTLRKQEKLYQPKEEKRVDSDRVGIETNRRKRNTDDGNREEEPVRKSRRQDTSDSEYNYELKHSHGSQVRSENPITDRWGADSARDHDVVRRGSGENRERQGRKHGRDEEEDDKDRERQQPERSRREQDDRRGSKYDRDGDRDSAKRARYDDGRDEEEDDKDRERQQPERSRREQDDRRGSKYDRDGDRDSTKRARYDDSRSAGRRYDEDDDRHGRRHSDGRHDDRRPRR